MRAPVLLIARRLASRPIYKALTTPILLALALLPAASRAVEPSTDHDVAIVGAGAAGGPAVRVVRVVQVARAVPVTRPPTDV